MPMPQSQGSGLGAIFSAGQGSPTPTTSAQIGEQPTIGSASNVQDTVQHPTPMTHPPMAPVAQNLQDKGRNGDSVLVHMTPDEVKGLQALAEAHGGSLTTNPHTGLPEANFLESLLPMVIGAILTPLTGGIINPMTAGLIVGAGTGLIKHDLGAGLMAGLSAFGGAGIGSAIAGGLKGVASAGLQAATKGLGTAATTAATTAAPAAVNAGNFAFNPAASAGLNVAKAAIPAGMGVQEAAPAGAAAAQAAGAAAAPNALPAVAQAAAPGILGTAKQFAGNVTNAWATNPVTGAPLTGMARTAAIGAGTTGLINTASAALTPTFKMPTPEKDKWNYEGPYKAAPRKLMTPSKDRDPRDSSEFQWFDNVNPYPAYTTASGGVPSQYANAGISNATPGIAPTPFGMASGGEVGLSNGSFVVDARTVSELGNGSSGAGQDLLARLGGSPIRGPGDGVSDSIPARINTGQRAKVARDEVKFDPEAVKKLGGGNPNKGARKLYALMDSAYKARKQAKRGQDTGLRSIMP